MQPIDRRGLFALIAAAFLPASYALAAQARTVILTISGLAGGPDLRLDRDAIEVRGLTSLDVETPWYGGRRHYEGIGLKRLLSDANVTARHDVHLHALNDYSVDLPWSVIDRYDPLLALKRDGEYMAVRDKGPPIPAISLRRPRRDPHAVVLLPVHLAG